MSRRFRSSRDGARFAPEPLSDDEHARLRAKSLEGAPPHVRGDYPEWLDEKLAATFGDERAEEAEALASRAPLDLRANTLKATREEAVEELAEYAPQPTRWSPWGLRIEIGADSKSPAIHAEPAYLKGQIEIQDEGSQLAALLSRRKARRAGDRSLRRRGRQDARARRHDGEQGPDLSRPTPTSAASRRSMSGWSAPARTTCRCARRAAPRMRSQAWKAAPTSC